MNLINTDRKKSDIGAINAHSRSKALVREVRERREVKPFLFFIATPAVKEMNKQLIFFSLLFLRSSRASRTNVLSFLNE